MKPIQNLTGQTSLCFVLPHPCTSFGCHGSSAAWLVGTSLYEPRKPGSVAPSAEALSMGCWMAHLISLPPGCNFKSYSLDSYIFLWIYVLDPCPFYFHIYLTDWQQGLHGAANSLCSFSYDCFNQCAWLFKTNICMRKSEGESQREQHEWYLNCKSVDRHCERFNVHLLLWALSY